jgi:hypothetical protein
VVKITNVAVPSNSLSTQVRHDLTTHQPYWQQRSELTCVPAPFTFPSIVASSLSTLFCCVPPLTGPCIHTSLGNVLHRLCSPMNSLASMLHACSRYSLRMATLNATGLKWSRHWCVQATLKAHLCCSVRSRALNPAPHHRCNIQDRAHLRSCLLALLHFVTLRAAQRCVDFLR